MNTEYEATYLNIDKDKLREKLKSVDAELLKPERKQKVYNFDLQSIGKNFWEWVRIRDDEGEITMAYKNISPDLENIEDQKEIEIGISSMDDGIKFIEAIGANISNYSEKMRESWKVNDVIVDIDTWPYLEPFVEIEGKSKDGVIEVSELLGFDFKDAKFCGAGKIYEMKYGIHPDKLSEDKMIRLTFEDPNPFLN